MSTIYFFKWASFVISIFLVLKSGQCSKQFRFDYEFSEQAEGWLKFHIIPATWESARMRCHAEGAILASPLNNQLKTAIITFVNKHFYQENGVIIHSGVHATFSQGDYSSIEGVPLLRLAITWAPGEPDNYENAESCLSMSIHRNGSMADIPCNNVLPYVCYKKNIEMEITGCGTTDPEYIFEPKTGSCYKFHGRGLIWSEAYMTCVAEGGHLVIINSDLEADVAKYFYQKYRTNPKLHNVMAVGFRDMSVHNNFMTIHGQTLQEAGYDKWSQDNPSNSTNTRIGDEGEFCGSFHLEGLLNDVYCHTNIAFLCEKHPNSLL